MSLAPRWYREEHLKEKILPVGNSRAMDLLDQQDYRNKKQAITKALDNQEFRYAQTQSKNVNSLVKQLEEV